MAAHRKRLARAARSAVRTAVLCAIAVGTALGQVSLLGTPGAGPQAKTRDELDEVGLVFDASDPQTVLERAQRFAQSYPTSEFLEAVSLTRMDAYRTLGRSADLVSAATLVLQLNPENPLALVSLAETYLSGDANYELHRERAVGHLRRAVSVLDSLAMPEGARSRDWVLAKRELLARAHGMLGYVHLKEEEFEEAATELELAAKLEPVGTYFYRAGLAFQFGARDRKARDAFERAIELGPEDVRRAARERLSELKEQRP